MFNEDDMGRRNVLLVGQLYVDTILNVPYFPEEDTKLRATKVYERIGGNTCNTAQVLTQFHHNVCYMSAVGSRETSNHIVDLLKSRKISHLEDTLLHREDTTTPSSIIIHSEKSGSRTIISHTNVQDITCNEFKYIFENINKSTNRWWIHFEGRNIDNVLQQIDWIHHKATIEQWRDHLVISVELEKPDRENIHELIERGDVVFFSKLYAQHHGFTDSTSFLNNYNLLKEKLKPRAIAFCTWGSEGASVLDNNIHRVDSYTPTAATAVVDTVGAGDTFVAGVIASHNPQQRSVIQTLQLACDLATKKVSQQGFDKLV